MILYKKGAAANVKERPSRVVKLTIDEKPERPKYVFTTNRERIKFIKNCETVIRSSLEYKEYITFLRNHMDMNRCAVLKGLTQDNGKKYSIEIHHAPFTLFELVDIILTKRESLNLPINPYYIADEVMQLHYDEKIGLIPLSITMHELVHNDKIFIPLQYLYQKYDVFYEEYEPFISDITKQKIELLINISMKCDQIQSDILDPEFVYIHIEGFDFPEISEEWGKMMKESDLESSLST